MCSMYCEHYVYIYILNIFLDVEIFPCLLWYTHNILIYNMLYIPNLLSTEYSEGFLSWPGQRAAINLVGPEVSERILNRKKNHEWWRFKSSIQKLFINPFVCFRFCGKKRGGGRGVGLEASWNAFRSRWFAADWRLTLTIFCGLLPIPDTYTAEILSIWNHDSHRIRFVKQ